MANKYENTVSLKEAIDKLLKVYKISDKMDELSIQKEWGKLMGPMVENRTKKIAIKNGVLHVQIESSVLRHELSFAKEKIIKSLNQQIGKTLIKEVLFY